MRLLAVACALLRLPSARAILGLDGDVPGLVVERASRSGRFDNAELQRRSSRFFNKASAPFAVNGSALPNITFDVGESYAGLLPITEDANEKRKLFFWFFPSSNPSSKNETVVWLNGGPGCSSMEGLVSGNGPINWLPGMSTPQPNPFTWLNLTNVVWVDQPLGVGYSQGEPDIEDEEELAMQFAGFWKKFVQLFRLENWRTYLTGESYAGVYIPYIADAFISAGDTEYYDLAGVHINAATVGDANLQMNIQLPAYVAHWNQVLGFNETFMADLQRRARDCGMTRYVREHLRFPPPAKPFRELLWQIDTWAELECDMFDAVLTSADLVNPCTNIYHITDTCPLLPSILGPTYANDTDHSSQPAWFSQPDVRAALHAPLEGSWARCTPSIFRNRSDNSLVFGDPYSQPPAATNLLSRVIEYTNNVIIGSGGLDMLVPTNGTLLVLQNVTWGGVQGFQRRPAKPFYSPYPPASNPAASSIAGLVGTWGHERGLTFYEVDLGGHELPRYAPGPSYRAMELLLGRIPSLDDVGDFTTTQNASSSEGCN